MLATATRRDVRSYFLPINFADMAVKDQQPSPRLAYYAAQLPDKETWFQTDEGYRIYKNVPIARTGSQ